MIQLSQGNIANYTKKKALLKPEKDRNTAFLNSSNNTDSISFQRQQHRHPAPARQHTPPEKSSKPFGFIDETTRKLMTAATLVLLATGGVSIANIMENRKPEPHITMEELLAEVYEAEAQRRNGEINTALPSNQTSLDYQMPFRSIIPNIPTTEQLAPSAAIFNQPTAPSVPAGPTKEEVQRIMSASKYGHLPYPEMTASGVPVTSGSSRTETLHPDAAEAFERMVSAARQEGIDLQAVSGFRSVAIQQDVFESKRLERGQTPEERAKVSAPAGYSEHHTGYAVDINSFSESFANTEAYRWLNQHAEEYGFELSFPQNNAQGISFEPWHWRFVGTPQAENLFTDARRVQQAREMGIY